MFKKSLMLTGATAMALMAAMLPAQGGDAQATSAGTTLAAAATPMTMDAESMRQAEATFRDHLAREYRALAAYEHNRMWDLDSADYFGAKASSGDDIPAVPQLWDIDARHMPELENGRQQLTLAFDRHAKALAPKEAAVAQAKYDCWVEQSAEGLTSEGMPMPWQAADIASCKEQFETALSTLNLAIAAAEPKPEPAPKVATAPKPAQEPTYRATSDRVTVYFDFDKANIKPSAHGEIGQLVSKLKDDKKIVVTVTGHTDRAGPADYNEELSRRRAEAVTTELTRLGLNVRALDELNVRAEGETNPAVPTADGVRNAQNRRAVIQAYAQEIPGDSNRVSLKPAN